MTRPRKPTVLKLIAGNPGKRPLPTHEPRFKSGVGQPPENLDSIGAQCWKRLAALLDRTGVLTQPDELALERLCDAYSEIAACKELIQRDGRTYVSKNAAGDSFIRPHPAVTQLRAADSLFKSYLTEFGLTPAARSKVFATPDDDADADQMARFFPSPSGWEKG